MFCHVILIEQCITMYYMMGDVVVTMTVKSFSYDPSIAATNREKYLFNISE